MMKYFILFLLLASPAWAYTPPTNCPTSTGELNYSTTTNAFSCNAPITLGTVTTGVWQGTAIANTYIAQLAGNTLTNTDWCTSDGTKINCNTAAPPTTSGAVIALFTGCSGTQYLGADGACHSGGGGSGTVTSIVAGAGLTGGTITTTGTIAEDNLTLTSKTAMGTTFFGGAIP